MRRAPVMFTGDLDTREQRLLILLEQLLSGLDIFLVLALPASRLDTHEPAVSMIQNGFNHPVEVPGRVAAVFVEIRALDTDSLGVGHQHLH